MATPTPATNSSAADSDRPLRLLHVADFRLDTPCQPLPGLPAAMQDVYVEARYRAVTRLVDVAISRQVDVVLVAGGTLDASLTGLRGPWHLVEQFTRLQAADIDVVWASGGVDAPHRWPSYVGLPASVRRFSTTARTPVVIKRDGVCPLVVGSLEALSPQSLPAESVRVTLVPGVTERPVDDAADYIACGGLPNRRIEADHRVAWPGPPQGRCFAEDAEHGALLVTLQPGRPAAIEPVRCDVVRWTAVEVPAAATYDALVESLHQAASAIQSPAEATIARLSVTGSGLAVERLRSTSRRTELLAELRTLTTGGVFLADLLVPAAPAAAADPDVLATLAGTERELMPRPAMTTTD